VRQVHRFLVRQWTIRLSLEKFQSVASREPAHLLEALDRNERGEWLAFALDDELIVTQGYSVEEIADPLPDLDRGHPLRHCVHHICCNYDSCIAC
jgi:hypothetical protein